MGAGSLGEYYWGSPEMRLMSMRYLVGRESSGRLVHGAPIAISVHCAPCSPMNPARPSDALSALAATLHTQGSTSTSGSGGLKKRNKNKGGEGRR